MKGGDDLFRLVAAPHAAAAAAAGGLEDDGKAVFLGFCQGFLGVVQRLVGTGDGGYPAGPGNGFGRELVTHLGQNLGRGADKGDARVLAGLGKVRVFGQKAVAGVDGVHIAALRQIDDAWDIQISAQGRFVLADEVGLVRLGAEQAVGVLVGIHGHRVQPQVVAGPEHADGDFAAIRNQDFVKLAFRHAVVSFPSLSEFRVSRRSGGYRRSRHTLACFTSGSRCRKCVPVFSFQFHYS